MLAARPGRRASGCWSTPALAEQVLPEIPALRLEIDEHAHHKDVYEHSLTALDRAIELERHAGTRPTSCCASRCCCTTSASRRPARIEPGGVVTFHHHDVLGAKLAAKRLRELRFDNDTVKAVAELIRLHLRFFGYAERRVDGFGRAPLRAGRRRPARVAAHPVARRRDHPQPAQGRRARSSPTTTSRSGSRRSPRRRSSPPSAPTSTASRSWRSSA